LPPENLLRSPDTIDRRHGSGSSPQICNLYSITRNQEAIRRLFQVTRDLSGNLPALPAVYQGTMAPVVRVARDGERELTMMRWGFPPPNLGNAPVTNVRILKSP
jgi:putative SOS response-associated peptidase YedK